MMVVGFLELLAQRASGAFSVRSCPRLPFLPPLITGKRCAPFAGPGLSLRWVIEKFSALRIDGFLIAQDIL